MVVRNEAFLDAREKYRAPLPSLRLVNAAQPGGFVLRRRVDLLAHGQRIQPLGQTDFGALHDGPKTAHHLELDNTVRPSFEPDTVAAGFQDLVEQPGR